jgi:hypothetical protein
MEVEGDRLFVTIWPERHTTVTLESSLSFEPRIGLVSDGKQARERLRTIGLPNPQIIVARHPRPQISIDLPGEKAALEDDDG